MYLRYYADVKDTANNDLRLEIYTRSYSGDSEEVLLLADAISIEYSADSLFDSLKPSIAHINMLNETLRTDLYTGSYNDITVKIYKNQNLFWVGFVTPNIYNQPYRYPYDPITIECIDIISHLSDIVYGSKTGITSLLDIIGKCLALADPEHYITKMYVDKNITLSNDDKFLEYAYLEERNFFDEKDEPALCSDVVGSILQCMGLTMVQYKDAFYIIEQSGVLHSSYVLNKYEYSNGSWSINGTHTLQITPKTPNQIGVADSNGQITLDSVYNKVTVIANNNPLDAILPDFGDKDDLVNQNVDQQHYETMQYTKDNTTYNLLAAYFTSQGDWQNFTTYSNGSAVSEVHMSTLDNSNNVAGMLWSKADSYNTADGEPSSLSWKTYLSIMNYALSPYTPKLELRKKPTMIFDGGYLIANITYKLSTNRYPHPVMKSQYDSFSTYGYYDKTWSDDTAEIGAGSWPNYTMFPCSLKIGDYFYNGEEWVSQSAYNAKKSWWDTLYYNYEGLDLGGHQSAWYRIWNTTHDDWEYVTQSQYNSFSGTKETGLCEYGHAHYDYRRDVGTGSGNEVFFPDEFYYEKSYSGLCFLIRKNVAGDAIMDAEYQLTNTVSYKMNIINAESGMAIKIDQPLYGEVEFIIYPPIDNKYGGSIAGLDPQWQSSKPTGTCRAVHISNLTLKYVKTSSVQDIFNNEDVNPDTIYSNVINSSFCKELPDVKLTVNTANDWANSYSYLIKRNGSTYDYIKTLQFGNSSKRPEERLVEKYVNYYSSPKYQYGNTLFNSNKTGGTELYPFQPIIENFGVVQRNFVTNNITYNLSYNTADLNAYQI